MARTGAKALTAQQIKWCQKYVETQSVVQACVAVGMKPTSHSYGFELLKNRKIIEYIREYQVLHARATTINAAWLINSIADTVQDNNPRDRVKAKELLLRITGTDPVQNRTLDLKEKALELEQLRLKSLNDALDKGLVPSSEIVYSILNKTKPVEREERYPNEEL